MPGAGRISDFLDLHANVSRRVRNLETGVHPTRSEAAGTDTIGPTTLTITNAQLRHAEFGTVTVFLQWQKRFGLVQPMGKVQTVPGVGLEDLAAQEIVTTLPAAARPLIDLTLRGQLSKSPWSFLYTVATNGTVTLLNPGGTDEFVDFSFEGTSWTAD